MNRKTEDEFTSLEGMTSIFDCAEYLEHHYPPYCDSWDNELKYCLPVAFSFAYTPQGHVSKYWSVLEFGRTSPTEDAISNWMEQRPRLRKGYRWSRPYWYSRPKHLKPACKVNGKVVSWN